MFKKRKVETITKKSEKKMLESLQLQQEQQKAKINVISYLQASNSSLLVVIFF